MYKCPLIEEFIARIWYLQKQTFSWVKVTVLLFSTLTCCWPFCRGQIQILQTAASRIIYDGFEAQPPCIVNKKAYKFSREMPSVLQLEALPALNVLTNVFPDDSPNLRDIALYFFPSECTDRSFLIFLIFFHFPFSFWCDPCGQLWFKLLIVHVLNWM